MKIREECFACAMRQAASAAAMATDDREEILEIMKRGAAILSEVDGTETPPALGEMLYGAISELTGIEDPFRELKERENRMASEMLPDIREMVEDSDDPFRSAVKVSIAGNALDPGALASYDVAESLRAAQEREGKLIALPELVSDLESGETVLFLADNCGEIVVDTLLIDQIVERFDCDVTVAVKDAPILNDVTMEDAGALGLDEKYRVISSGLRMPGTYYPETSPEFKKFYRESDVVIAKGQGNWETLEDTDRRVYFLFQAKCDPVTRMNDCELGEYLLLKSM